MQQDDVVGPDSNGDYSVTLHGRKTDFRCQVKVRAHSSAGAGDYSERLGTGGGDTWEGAENNPTDAYIRTLKGR